VITPFFAAAHVLIDVYLVHCRLKGVKMQEDYRGFVEDKVSAFCAMLIRFASLRSHRSFSVTGRNIPSLVTWQLQRVKLSGMHSRIF